MHLTITQAVAAARPRELHGDAAAAGACLLPGPLLPGGRTWRFTRVPRRGTRGQPEPAPACLS